MRRHRTGLRVVHLLWVVCLFVPPAIRLALDFWRVRLRLDTDAVSQEHSPEPRLVGAEAAFRLRQAEQDLKTLGATLVSEEFDRVLARLLPLRDPSTSRNSRFVGIRGATPVPADTPPITPDYHLFGRVVEVLTPPSGSGPSGSGPSGSGYYFAVAQIQTVLDPSFRVRFVAGDATGLAGGTGATTDDGHPLLEIIFLEGSRNLTEGEVIVTDGAGGVYAPGIHIGSVTPGTGHALAKRRSRLPLIRTEVVLDRHDQVILLADLMRLSAAKLLYERRATP